MRGQPKRQNRERDQDHETDQIGGNKGQNANEMVEKLTSCTTVLITKTFIPTGG